MLYLSSNSTIMHEFIHSLGMYHVQSRADRDKYVEIKWDNIKKGKEHNFNKHKSTLTFGVPYDPLSIMHYEYWSFAKDSSKPTIVSKVIKVLIILTYLYILVFENRFLVYQLTNLDLLNNLEILTSG